MERPQYAEMLLARRRQLGVSFQQAARVLKLKEEVLIAFEEGDFDAVPKGGYAQGMLSSYARYLGLNAREIVELFVQESYEAKSGTTSHELRRRSRLAAQDSGIMSDEELLARPAAYADTSVLFKSDEANDFFQTTSVAPRSASVPLVGSRSSTSSAYSHSEYANGHAYNSADMRSRATARAMSRRTNDENNTGNSQSESFDAQERIQSSRERIAMRESEIMTREVSSEFVDDLVHDERASAYEASSAPTARRTLHTSVAPVERPNVRRRSAREPERSGGFFSDSRNILLAIVLVLGIALTVLIISSVRSCINSRLSPGSPVAVDGAESEDNSSIQSTQGTITTVPVVSENTSDEENNTDVSGEGEGSDANAAAAQPDDASSDAATDTTSEGDSTTSADAAQAAPSQTSSKPSFEVSVAAGELSWIEISVDGTTLVAETVTGPWSATYTPESNFSISVGNHLATTVTQDGEAVAYNYSASGVGNISVDV